MTDQTSSTDYVPIQMVYLGQRLSRDGKRLQAWMRVDLLPTPHPSIPQLAEQALYWRKPLVTWASPGAVVNFKALVREPEGLSITTPKKGENTPYFSHSWPHKEDVQRWTIADRVTSDILVSQGKAKKTALSALPEAALEPYRKAYSRANAQGKRIILAWVIEQITGGKS